MLVRVALILVGFLQPTVTLAETFDYNGSARILCTCPTVSGSNTCVRPDAKWDYRLSIAVHDRLTVNLTEVCIAKRESPVCCERPKEAFKGIVEKKCPTPTC